MLLTWYSSNKRDRVISRIFGLKSGRTSGHLRQMFANVFPSFDHDMLSTRDFLTT